MEMILTAAATLLMFTPGILELAVITLIFVFLATPVVVVIWLLTKRTDSRDTGAVAQDEQILREMNEGLQRMEERIDALETLLGDEKSKGERK
jgi:phage shock protein B